jgi:hypothetical protein
VRLKEAKQKGYDYVSDCVLDGAMEVR